MGAILGPSLYGAVRGAQDAERFDMEKRGFEADQAVRAERLRQEQELGPLRTRALQGSLDDADHARARRAITEPQQDELAKLGVDEARYNAEERAALRQRARQARELQDTLQGGLRDFMMSGDPQHVADAFGKTDPRRAGTKAVRNEDGSITLTNPNAPSPLVFRNISKDGQTISADDQLQHFVLKTIDPVAALQKEVETRQKTEIEGAKQSAITAREIQKEGVRATAAEARANRERERRMTTELRAVSSEVLSGLKTSSIPGHFANVYSSDDDAKLVPSIKERAAAIYKAGADDDEMTPAKAAKQAIEETRTVFGGAKKAATDAATRLQAAGIDPTDRTALEGAMKAGNKDAKALVEALGSIKGKLGEDAARYLFDQLPRKKK